MLGIQASFIGGGHPIMQRVGDFRLGKRSTRERSPAISTISILPCLPRVRGLGLSVPAKVLRSIWNALKLLDTVVPGVLHPSTILYYPEIKLYANRPMSWTRPFWRPPRAVDRRRGGNQPGYHGAWASGYGPRTASWPGEMNYILVFPARESWKSATAPVILSPWKKSRRGIPPKPARPFRAGYSPRKTGELFFRP
jgi:hypothetical protein